MVREYLPFRALLISCAFLFVAQISVLPTAFSQSIPAPNQIPDPQAYRLMAQLVSGGETAAAAAITEIAALGDTRFIPVLIETIRAIQLGLLPWATYDASLATLGALSGQAIQDDWGAWVEWYGTTDLKPPPGFTTWKGELLARVDPRFGEFLQDKHSRTIRAEEILWGGVRVDGIPALDNPATLPASEAGYLEEKDLVFAVEINGEARAYPLRIMDWHEMANDVVGNVPISLAYCTLCGAAIAFRGQANDGNTYTFGSSGFLYRSNKLMYDRQTRTLWNQFTGTPVLGRLAPSGDAPPVTLDLLPVLLTTWGAWKQQNPEGRVLDIQTGFQRPYHAGAAYGPYFSSPKTMFPVWRRRGLLEPKAWIFGLRIDGVPKAYPVHKLFEDGVINDELAGRRVVIVGTGAPLSVQGADRRGARVNYGNGGEVRAYERAGNTFRPSGRPGTLLDGAGQTWRITEPALIGPDGQRAPRIPGHLAYWFGWYAFFSNTLVHGESHAQ